MINQSLKKLSAMTLLLTCLVLTGCGNAPKTDGPISAVEQEELSDQLMMIQQKQN